MNPTNFDKSKSGTYAVLAQLAIRGIDAKLIKEGSNKSVINIDLPEAVKSLRLIVRTRYKQKAVRSKLFGYTIPWRMVDADEEVSNPTLFYCFVSIAEEAKSFRFFIVPSQIVAKYVKEQHRYWLMKNNGNVSRVRNFRFGLDQLGYQIETLYYKDYEDNWHFAEVSMKD